MRYRYRAYCADCNESNDALLGDTRAWEMDHDAKHRRGKCSGCGHWNDSHRVTDAAMREYLRTGQELCCVKNMGMGDFCGCPGGEGNLVD